MAAPDVSEDTGDREVFPTPFAFPVAAQVTAQRCDVGVGQPGRQPSEEAALLPRHATAVYQDSRPTSTVREDEGAGQAEAVSGADSLDNGLCRHVAPYGISVVARWLPYEPRLDT